MKNALIFYYNIYTDNLEKLNDNYYFHHRNDNFIIMPYKYNINEALEIYNLNQEMRNRGMDTYEIIITSSNNVLYEFENEYYILMKLPKFNNRMITYEDVINFNIGTSVEIKNLNKSNWPYYWEHKIDFIEYQFLQFEKKFPLIKSSINYYIGKFENAISYYYENVTETKVLQLAHRRVSADMDLLEFYNPLNIIIDYKERDIAEYFKSYIYTKNYTSSMLESMILKLEFSRLEAILFISRLLFPTNYFDLYERIINNKEEETKIKDIINREKSYLYFIKFLFYKYSNYNVPIIEWIIKEE